MQPQNENNNTQCRNDFALPPSYRPASFLVMAESPPPCPSLLSAKSSYITSWIAGLPLSPPADTHLLHNRPLKRKRPNSAPVSTTRRGLSLEKRRRVDDDVMPGESASVADLSHPLDLERHNTFSPPGSQVGSREAFATLKYASPPILTESYAGAQLPANGIIMDKVMDAIERLCPGQIDGWVPRCLKVRTHAPNISSSRN